ncbi:Olfactory receptor 9G4 [Myotis davidii]|uniref:Olfactory receptor 9G4 n=1 Tax=Myotis davidii TaxID=225400 RepID=L5MDJ5_MYODS|nr:Olfactory receptor 9G4 [Myotis davidii]
MDGKRPSSPVFHISSQSCSFMDPCSSCIQGQDPSTPWRKTKWLPCSTLWLLGEVGFTVLSSILAILISYLNILLAVLKICSASGRRKAFSTCVSHLISVMFFYGSLLFIYSSSSSIYSLEKDKVAALFYTVVNPLLNPLIYSLRNKDVKEAFWKATKAIRPQR